MVLWCYAAERRADILSCSSRNIYELGGQVPHTKLTGQQTDISALVAFEWYEWYEWVYYRDPIASHPHPSERLGGFLGSVNHVGTAMSQWVMNEKGNVLPQQTLRHLTPLELHSNIEKKKCDVYDKIIHDKLGDSTHPPPKPLGLNEENIDPGEEYEIPDADEFQDYDK